MSLLLLFNQSVASGSLIEQSFSDSVSISDTVIKEQGKSLLDVISLSDDAIKEATKLLAETFVLSDLAVKELGKSLFDNSTIIESFISTSDYSRAFNDVVTLSDSMVKGFFISFLDSVVLGDNTAVQRGIIKDLSESLNLSDNISLKEIGKNISDILNLTDSLNKHFESTENDSVAFSDLITKDVESTRESILSLVDLMEIKILKLRVIEILQLISLMGNSVNLTSEMIQKKEFTTPFSTEREALSEMIYTIYRESAMTKELSLNSYII